MATKKHEVPDLGDLLGKIAEKRSELPKSPVQAVQPVNENKVQEGIAVNTQKRQNIQNQAETEKPKGIGGRPSSKKDGIEYVKISPRIPKSLKKMADIALAEERFNDVDGKPIRTLDELAAIAIEKLLAK
jgi:hypothetical protein